MTTTTEHIDARDDFDLQRRLTAAAEQLGVPDAASRVAMALGTLVSTPITVNGENTSITAVHAYAAAVRKEYLDDARAMAPGLNPGAVTDAHLSAAVTAVIGTAGTPGT